MQRFTIQDYDLRKTISTEKKILLFTDVYPTKDKKFRPLPTFNHFFCLLVTYAQFLTMIFYMIEYKNDVSKIAETLQFFMTQIILISKLINFSVNKAKLLALEDSLADPDFYGFTMERLELIKEKMKPCVMIVRIYRFLCIVCVIFYGLFPYIDTSKKRTLPLPGWFPYDVDKYYHQTTAFQISVIYVSAYNNSTSDCLTWLFTAVAAGQLMVLRENLKNIHYKLEKNFVEQQLVACIKHHKKIAVLVKSIEDTFAVGIFVQFFCSIIVICMSGFQMTIAPLISTQMLFTVLYFTCIMLQGGLYCWFGHDIMTTSSEIGRSLYLTNWYESDVKLRKVIVIFLERTKKPIILTAGKLVVLSLITFVTLLRSSYSYFAVLQRLYNK